MIGKARPRLLSGFGLGMLAACMFVYAPAAEAQFFWSPWFQEQPKRPKVRAPKAKPRGDDLPPIVPKESAAPPPPDDRPYDPKLLRLAEILGAVHYLRELCGAEEGQLWRNQMKDVLKNEGSTAVRRAKLVNSFNNGYRGYRRTYRTCTSSATLAITRFSAEGAQIAVALANPSSAYAKRTGPAEGETEEGGSESAPAPADETATDGDGALQTQDQSNADPNAQSAPAGAASPAGAPDGSPAAATAPTASQSGTGQQPQADGSAASQPQTASTSETQANPDEAAETEQPRKKKRKARRKPREVPRSTGFFFRN